MSTVLIKDGKHRNSSIELLRIISMVMIVSCHFATHGGFSFDANTLSVPRLWWNVIEMGGNFGVNVFVLISGYFLVESNSGLLNLKGILKFWGEVFIYSVAIYLVFGIAGISEFGLASCIETVFPITFGAWWFASTYFVLYLLHPFLNMLLKKIDKNTYEALLVMEIVLWCIIPTITTLQYESNSLLWFITLYCVSGYVRLYGLNPRFSAKYYFFFWVLFSTLRYMSCVVLMVIGTKFPAVAGRTLLFYGQQSIFTFLSALSLFMVFEKINMGYNKWINIIASATFGVYLIHDNNLVRPFLWRVIFKNAQYQDSVLIIPYSIMVTVIVYIVCTFIDLLRQHTVEKMFMKFISLHSDRIMNAGGEIMNRLKALFS